MGDTIPDWAGARLRAVRLERGLTLEKLAEMAGLTRGYLSLLERDLKTPSLAALIRLADALKTEVGQLFGDRAPAQSGYVVYRHKGFAPDKEPEFSRTVPLAPGQAGKVMEPFFLYPKSKPVSGVTHSGEELIVVLRGEVQVVLGDEELTLQANDSVYFAASTEHQLRSIGAVRAEVLVVVSRAPETTQERYPIQIEP